MNEIDDKLREEFACIAFVDDGRGVSHDVQIFSVIDELSKSVFLSFFTFEFRSTHLR